MQMTYRGIMMVKGKKSAYHEKRENNKHAIVQMFNQVKYDALDIDYVFEHLSKNGVDIKVSPFKNGLFGVSFVYKNTKIKASKIHKMLTVVPDKENGGYKANKKFQVIIDQNLSRMLGKRTDMDLVRDLNDITKEDYSQDDFFNESLALFQFNKTVNWDRIRQMNDEERQKRLSKKYKRKSKQLGFKVQI